MLLTELLDPESLQSEELAIKIRWFCDPEKHLPWQQLL